MNKSLAIRRTVNVLLPTVLLALGLLSLWLIVTRHNVGIPQPLTLLLGATALLALPAILLVGAFVYRHKGETGLTYRGRPVNGKVAALILVGIVLGALLLATWVLA